MCIFESAASIELNDSNKYFLEEITNNYVDYVKSLEKMDDNLLKHYLDVIKQNEILNNQQAEEENSFLISLYNNMHKQNSLDVIIKMMSDKDDINLDELKKLHKILMKGTNGEIGAENFRDDDNKFVGAINLDGTKRIDYIPITYTKIPENMAKVLEMYNSLDFDNPFMNPFIVHGLISVLQPFDDGNTRLSRLIQHAKIWKNTNLLYNKNFSKPLIYLSRNYLLSRGNYRNFISLLAQEHSNEVWNKWIKYNLHMVEEQLFYLNNNVKRLIKR